jgi:hypothetical protein
MPTFILTWGINGFFASQNTWFLLTELKRGLEIVKQTIKDSNPPRISEAQFLPDAVVLVN